MKWIIGDIHGTYLTMMALIDKIKTKDENAEIIFVGDFCDKGPRSKEVIEYILSGVESGEFQAVRGNHEEIMYHGIFYPFGIDWDANGGAVTRYSYYGGKPFELDPLNRDKLISDGNSLMEEHAKKLIELPLFLKFDDEIDGKKLLVSHAPCAEFIDEYLELHGGTEEENEIAMQKYEDEYSLKERIRITKNGDLINMNRNLPTKENKYFNITGHNITGKLLTKYKNIECFNKDTEVIIDKELGYACIDTGAVLGTKEIFGGKLTAISFPGLEVIQQENID